jgi:phospholipid/cholesterol/gamma-HCH transport system ATP-binding protein
MAATPDAPAVVLRGLHKQFGQQTVLDDVSLTVAAGETVAVLGRSGVGKSVLLKLIVGLQEPDRGSIAIEGEDIVGLPVDRLNAIRARMGFLFQDAALYDAMTLEDNVAFPLQRQQKLSPAEQQTRARTLLADMGMGDARQKMPSEVSGGMKKRAGLARALALDPDILLFDEPTAGLDPITCGEIEALMRDLKARRHVAAVVVTHDLHCVRAVADRVAFLSDARIVFDGPVDDLAQCRDDTVQQFLAQAGGV